MSAKIYLNAQSWTKRRNALFNIFSGLICSLSALNV